MNFIERLYAAAVVTGIILFILLFSGSGQSGIVIGADFAGGSGTADDPYIVENADQLDQVRNYPGDHFVMSENIDLSGYSRFEEWQPIGDESSPFTGVFDGGGHEITSLEISSPRETKVGLFGSLDNATVKNLRLVSVDIDGGEYVGGLAGVNWGDQSRIKKVFVGGEVTGERFIGGIVGSNTGHVEKSFARAELSGQEYVGGLIAQNFAAVIEDCYFKGEVEGEKLVGGFVGENYRQGRIHNSYSAAVVKGNRQKGGFVGSGNAGADNFYDSDVSGFDYNGYQGTPKKTEKLLKEETFQTWDFDDVWKIDRGESYPFFRWQEEHIPYAGEN